jgi:serine/threonine protein kinase
MIDRELDSAGPRLLAHVIAPGVAAIDEGELIAGRYRLISRLGNGAMGVVWLARDERLHRTVAIKQLLLARLSGREADEANRRAMREGRITARLQHPHAIAVHDVAEHEGQPCLIMEYLPSRSLATVLSTQDVLAPDEVARIGSQVASALAAAHEAGIVHRDIKPGNVLLAADGTAKITDFGVSHAVGDVTVTATGILAGTPAYLAPEVAQGHSAGFPSDVFSLGATLYTALEGMPPFGLNNNAIALLHQVASGEITPPRRSGPLTPVLLQLLQRDPEHRPTMHQAQGALAALAAGLAEFTGGPSAPARPRRRIDSHFGPVPRTQRTLIQAIPSERSALVGLTGADVTVDRAPATGDSGGRPGRRRPLDSVIAVVLAAGLPVAALISHSKVTDGNTPQPVSTSGGSAQNLPALPIPPGPSRTTQVIPAATPVVLGSPPDTPDTPEQQQRATTGYHALTPGNRSAAWKRPTADYQPHRSRGRHRASESLEPHAAGQGFRHHREARRHHGRDN